MKNTFTLAAFLCLYLNAIAQPATFNVRTRVGFPAAVFTSVIPTDSCYYVTGVIADTVFPFRPGALFARFDLQGNPVLIKSVVDPDHTYETWRPTLLEAEDGFWVSGQQQLPEYKGLLIHYNTAGDTLEVFSFRNYYFPDQNFIFPTGMAPLGNKFVLASNMTSNGFSTNMSLACVNRSGELFWHKNIGSNIKDLGGSVIPTTTGTCIVGGWKTNSGIVFHNFDSQAYLFEVDSLGQMLWQYLSPADQLIGPAYGLHQEADGSIVVASMIGWEDPTHPTYHVIRWHNYVFKLNAQREFLWGWEFPSPFFSERTKLNKLIACADGSGYVAAGVSSIGTTPTNGIYWGRVAKLSPDGDSIWDRHYAFPIGEGLPSHELYDVKETPDGGFILCGESQDYYADSFPQQGWLLKLDSEGCLVPGCGVVDGVRSRPKAQAQLLLYPNPANDWLAVYVQAGAAGAVPQGRLRIVNMQGQVMGSFEAPRGQATYMLPVAQLLPGQYVLQWLGQDGLMATQVFVKG